ncbi:MAG TPA: hypothetical protein VMN60_07705 [Longimicrobiales bacterium]|nr:hypothetical protein [Longimicrobiales bacterium]
MRRMLMLVALSTGCATVQETTDRELRAADDVPPAFTTEDGVAPVQSCSNTLIDPRDQTRLRLMRSADTGGMYRGDYDVPSGKYGVGSQELLRINCATGEPLGIVRN